MRNHFPIVPCVQERPKVALILACLVSLLYCVGCSTNSLGKGMIGRPERYDYSPSIIQSGNIRQFWWCGMATNPAKPSEDTDAVLYESVNLVTGAIEGPRTVLAGTPGAWDSTYNCNPRVIGGIFDNPLGDGRSFQYAMYYVGTQDKGGLNNSIGVAFSNDGIQWAKYPTPIIYSPTASGYGAGQPVVYNSDQKAAISLYYEDSDFTSLRHIAATSSDGLHFTVQGTLTTSGLNPDYFDPSWGDMAYDTSTKSWYALFNEAIRSASTTANKAEWGQPGVELYRIPAAALLTGSTPWQLVTVFDTNRTGFESNFIGGFVHDQFGSVNVGSYPVLQMYLSVSNPQPRWNASPINAETSSKPSTWDIAPVEWTPDHPLMPFYRYKNSHVREVTTGWVHPSAAFQQESLLGQLYESQQKGATVPFYGCKQGNEDYFVSLDNACEGQRVLGRNGYAYSQPNASLGLVALYRCRSDHDHFVSRDPKCEGQMTDELLGYVVPQ